MTLLAWGQHYAMVRPSYFRIDYQINPFMDPANQPDVELAMNQWKHLVGAIETEGGRVEVIEQRADAPDMVYAMNLGLAVQRPDGTGSTVLSHMRFAERRMETASAHDWWVGRDVATSYVGRDGIGAHFEAGDAFAWGDALVVGYGPRTEELGLKHPAADLEVRVRGLQITHPSMYHLDLAFCPIDDTTAIVCPEAFDEVSAAALMEMVPNAIVLSETEALETFAANSIVIGRKVLMPACPDHVRTALEGRGFEVDLVDVTEFHKGGGSIRCLTNPLDVAIGRDLPAVAGGEVVLP